MYITFILIHRLQRYTFICNWQNGCFTNLHILFLPLLKTITTYLPDFFLSIEVAYKLSAATR